MFVVIVSRGEFILQYLEVNTKPGPNLILFEDPTLQGPGVDPSTPCCSFANLTDMSFLWIMVRYIPSLSFLPTLCTIV